MIYRPGGISLTKKAAEIAGIQPGYKVLDVGCGTGESLKFLADTFHADVVGVDVSSSMIKKAKVAYPELSFFVAAAKALPFDDAYFDAVFSECVLALMENIVPAVREMSRVLKTGGSLVITTPVCKQELPDGEQSTLFTAKELLRVLEEHGLTVTYQSDEQKVLTQYVADAVFRYGSVEEMIRQCSTENEASIFPCDIQNISPKDIGYHSVIAKKKSV